MKIKATPKLWFLLLICIFIPVNFMLANLFGLVIAIAVGVGVLLSPARWFD